MARRELETTLVHLTQHESDRGVPLPDLPAINVYEVGAGQRVAAAAAAAVCVHRTAGEEGRLNGHTRCSVRARSMDAYGRGQEALQALFDQLFGPETGDDQLGRLKAAVCEHDDAAAGPSGRAAPRALAGAPSQADHSPPSTPPGGPRSGRTWTRSASASDADDQPRRATRASDALRDPGGRKHWA